MHLAVKVIGALIGAAFLAGRKGGVDILTYYVQGDPQWRSEHLGFSDTVTIWGAGCMLTSLGMAAGALWGADHDFDPSTMNGLCKTAGAFSGALLELPDAAGAVDLVAPSSERIHAGAGASIDQLRSLIRATLAKGGVCLVNVDKKFTGTGEHWLCVHKEQGGQFLGADPATGADTPIDVSSMRNPYVSWCGGPYDVVGVAPIYRGAAT